MGDQADDVSPRRGQLRETPAAHPRVELHVQRDALGDRPTGDDELEPRLTSRTQLGGPRRAEDEQTPVGHLRSQRERLGDGRDAQGVRAGRERGLGAVRRAVAVPVRLHYGPQLGAVEDAQERGDVPPQGSEVDRDLTPGHERSGQRWTLQAVATSLYDGATV